MACRTVPGHRLELPGTILKGDDHEMIQVPRATYRIQFHPGFTFLDAAELADYLAALGVSHLYGSPYFQAAPGSTHGYDVVNPTRVNEELGGAKGHQRLCSALQDHGLGQILDMVPNPHGDYRAGECLVVGCIGKGSVQRLCFLFRCGLESP
jgi:hypothetical protein